MRTSNRPIVVKARFPKGKEKSVGGRALLIAIGARHVSQYGGGFIPEPVVGFKRGEHGALTWWSREKFEATFGKIAA